MSTVEVELTVARVGKGVQFEKGSKIPVSRAAAKRLVELGKAKYVDPADAQAAGIETATRDEPGGTADAEKVAAKPKGGTGKRAGNAK